MGQIGGLCLLCRLFDLLFFAGVFYPELSPVVGRQPRTWIRGGPEATRFDVTLADVFWSTDQVIVKNPVIETPVSVATRQHPAWKRGLDLALTIMILPMLAPFLVLIATYIRCVSQVAGFLCSVSCWLWRRSLLDLQVSHHECQLAVTRRITSPVCRRACGFGWSHLKTDVPGTI